MIDFQTDGHVHTSFCNHAVGTMREYVEAAIKRGLSGIIFLEHLEKGINYPERTWLTEDDFSNYYAEGLRLREEFAGKILVGIGVEVGFNPSRVDEIQDFLGRYGWDRIGLSYHFMDINGLHYNLVSKKNYNIDALGTHGVSTVVSDYLETLLAAVGIMPADVVCHLDAVLRYHPQIAFNEQHQRLITRILEAMRLKNMALEVNCSGFKVRGEPFPTWRIIAEAAGMGVKLAAASDAHRPEDVGRGFGQLKKYEFTAV